MLTLSQTSLAQVIPQNLNPAIRSKLVDGVKCAVDLSLTSQALASCQNDLVATAPAFWQTPSFVIGGVSVAFAWGLVLGFTKCFGSCK